MSFVESSTPVDVRLRNNQSWVVHLCCVQVGSNIRREAQGMAGGRLAVRAARTLVARKLDGKLLRVVILQGNELRLLALGEDGA